MKKYDFIAQLRSMHGKAGGAGYIGIFRIFLPGVAAIALLSCQSIREPDPDFDLLLIGGKCFDGSGEPAEIRDIGIKADKIVFIGDAAAAHKTAGRVINAAGLVVSPGFIDPHTHALDDLSNPDRNKNLNYLTQGVTTVFVGNDGGGPFQIKPLFATWQKQGIGTNAALLVGHGTVRKEVMGMENREPSAEELEMMKKVVRMAMEDGAFGLSTGLYYAPGSFSNTNEVVALAKVAAEAGGIYDSHLRDESSYNIGLLAAIREAIQIGADAGIPVHIAHIKALGVDVRGQSDEAISLIKKARQNGIRVTADQYPYLASGTSMGNALVPRRAFEGGREALTARLTSPESWSSLKQEMRENLRRRGGGEALLIVDTKDTTLAGKTLRDVAEKWRMGEVEAARKIIIKGRTGVASFNMQESDLENFMRQDFVITSSDGTNMHPRKYGSFTRKLRTYVYEKKLFDLAFAIRASSALTAEIFAVKERGMLKEGYFADIIVFDEKIVSDMASFTQPEQLSVGMKFVIVNGDVVIDGGTFSGKLAGTALRK